MRVVAGLAGGRRLRAPVGRQVRPTSERVREALFNSLGSLDVLTGATVLDLFAGTGALGIEALSRGATSAVFVDADPRAVLAVKDNLAATGLADRGRVVQADVFRYLATAPTGPTAATGPATGPEASSEAPRFDIAFADPPYAFTDWDRLLAIVPAGLVAMEARDHVALGPGWDPLRSRRYGDTVVTLARRRPFEPSDPEKEG
jgi:16S rRNA (guanine966-N2)-methyltransferase